MTERDRTGQDDDAETEREISTDKQAQTNRYNAILYMIYHVQCV